MDTQPVLPLRPESKPLLTTHCGESLDSPCNSRSPWSGFTAQSAAVLAFERRALLAYVTRLTGNPTLSEDLTQDVLVKAAQSWQQFRGHAEPRTWLFAIAKNLVHDCFRANPSNCAPAGTHDLAWAQEFEQSRCLEDDILASEVSMCVRLCIEQLPAPHYKVLQLHDLVGFTHREFADLVGVSEANSRVLLYRARQLLKQRCSETCEIDFTDEAICVYRGL